MLSSHKGSASGVKDFYITKHQLPSMKRGAKPVPLLPMVFDELKSLDATIVHLVE